MSLKKTLKELERKGIVSRKPHPSVGFVLFFISLILYITINNLNIENFLLILSEITVALSFVFAVLHLAVVRILSSK